MQIHVLTQGFTPNTTRKHNLNQAKFDSNNCVRLMFHYTCSSTLNLQIVTVVCVWLIVLLRLVVLVTAYLTSQHHPSMGTAGTTGDTPSNSSYVQSYCQPPPAHQPLPAHFNTATHIAMRPGTCNKDSPVRNILSSIFIRLDISS